MKRKPLTMPEVKSKFFAFNGGLDLVTPPVEMKNGSLRSASNVEIGINGGYVRLGGYERYSGKTKPSAATYSILTCTITGTVALGAVLTDGRENQLLQSNNLAIAPWAQNIGGFWTSAASTAILGPTGLSADVTKFTVAATGSVLFTRQSGLSIPAGNRTASLYVYVPSGQGITNWTVGADWQDVETNTGTTSTVLDAWVRISVSKTLAATRTALDFNILFNGATPSGGSGKFFYAAFGQENSGTSAVTYTATTSAVINGGTIASGTVIALPTGQAVLTLITGTFETGNIKVGGTTVGTCVGAQEAGAAATQALNATYLNLAADVYRALIAAVPGSGSVLGIHQYNGHKYAFRNNAGGTAAVMHVESASGWTAVALGREIAFTSGGTVEVVAGNTIVGATSAATAIITKVILDSGSWAAGTAAGRLFFASQTGTFQAENLNVGINLNVATIAGNSTAITLLPNGRYEFENWNFGGGTATKKMYGADGVNRGFEYDGTTFVQIVTGMTTDAPVHVKSHKNHLFYSFSGSAQHSAPGTPYVWSVVSGASELACGDDIAGFVVLAGTQSGAAMGIFTRNRTLVLYGNGLSDWNLVSNSDEAGALPYTTQFIAQGIVLDDQGITLLDTTQQYGNFQNAVISDKITPFLNDLIDTAIASCIVRRKNQYRLFFSGGDAVYMTLKGRKIMGMTPVSLPNPVTCISSAEGSGGQEEIYFGSTDGFVYQMDIGTSFDGATINWYGELAFNHFGGPRQLKTFRKAVTEVTGSSYCEFSFSYSLAYGSTEYDASPTATITTSLSGTNWDSFTWDQFFWDGRTLAPSEADVTGTAENVALMFSGNSDEFEPFSLNSALIHYTPRRGMR